ncbi:hypothetical protein [Calidifontibacter indicus]|uniref:hypothetical protein n=1 Tax=Calidifontibacter indicus TaxID=419650 RepID=UPI003D7470E9
MNTAATNSLSTSKRVWRGVLAATSVALVGASVMPAAQAEAAGVKATNYAVVSPAPVVSAVSPTDLPRSDGRSISYQVGKDVTMRAV